MMKKFVLLLAAGVLAGCGGSWKDDPKNWERAFRQPKPADVEIVHSTYWKASGVAPQYRYFFDIKSNAALSARFAASPDLAEVIPQGVAIITNICGRKPDWFMPKSPQNYRTWKVKSLKINMAVYEDLTTHELYVCDYLMLPDTKAQFQ